MAAAVEKVGAEDSAASRGAIQEQRQLLAELSGGGGAGLASSTSRMLSIPIGVHSI